MKEMMKKVLTVALVGVVAFAVTFASVKGITQNRASEETVAQEKGHYEKMVVPEKSWEWVSCSDGEEGYFEAKTDYVEKYCWVVDEE